MLIWGKDRKTIEAGLEWKKAALRREQLQFLIKHPSFERVRFTKRFNSSLNVNCFF